MPPKKDIVKKHRFCETCSYYLGDYDKKPKPLVCEVCKLSQRESFVTVKIFESKILINFDIFEHPESE